MDTKKILIICRAFYPNCSPRAFRATELAVEFSRQGHKVTVHTVVDSQSQVDFANEHGFSLNSLGKLRWKNLEFKNSMIGYYVNRLQLRLMMYLFEYPDVELVGRVKRVLKKEAGKSFDLLISIAVPHPIHWGLARVPIKKDKIAKIWVADCGDPYMGCETVNWGRALYFRWVEKWWMRKADFVSIPFEGARSAYYREFHDKIVIIPQGIKFPKTDIVEHVSSGVPRFAYAGGFIPRLRDPRPFLECLCNINEDFRFVVYTNQPNLLEGYSQRLGGKMEVKRYIPRNELIRNLASMDFLVNFDNNVKTALPSKLIDYAIAGRPILNIKKEFACGDVRRFLGGDYRNSLKVESTEKYRIESVCGQFLSLIQN